MAMGNKVFNVPLQTAEPPRYSGSDCSKSTLVLIYLVKNFCFPHDCSKKKKTKQQSSRFSYRCIFLIFNLGGDFFHRRLVFSNLFVIDIYFTFCNSSYCILMVYSSFSAPSWSTPEREEPWL